MKDNNVEYRIVEAASTHELERKMKDFIGWGFKPLGGTNVLRYPVTNKAITTTEFKYSQAVIKAL